MKPTYRNSLVAAAVAALLAAPAWSGTNAPGDASAPPGARQSAPMDEPVAPTPEAGRGGAFGGPQTQSASPLYAMTPGELRGIDVVGPDGHQVGEVSAVVRSRQGQSIQAVVSSGGFLGIGAKKVIVPLDTLQYVDGQLHTSATKEELKAKPAFQAEQYVELQPSDRPISEFSAFEPVPEESSPAGIAPPPKPGGAMAPAPGAMPGQPKAPAATP